MGGAAVVAAAAAAAEIGKTIRRWKKVFYLAINNLHQTGSCLIAASKQYGG